MERKLTFAAVIPSRGLERSALLNWARIRSEAMLFDEIIVVDYPPISNELDLYQRLAVGFAKAAAAHIDFVSVIEDDDYYSLDYLNQVKEMAHKTVDIVGFDRTTYYHLKTKGINEMHHPGRSSLFTTTIATKIFPSLIKHTTNPYLDITWWNQAQHNMAWRLINKEFALGIKHGIGKPGGNGHTSKAMYRQFDTDDLEYLRCRVDKVAFNFYTNTIIPLL